MIILQTGLAAGPMLFLGGASSGSTRSSSSSPSYAYDSEHGVKYHSTHDPLSAEFIFADEAEKRRFLAAQASHLSSPAGAHKQASASRRPVMQPLVSSSNFAAHQTNISAGKGLEASALANKYNDTFMTEDKKAYHSGFGRPVENGRGELNLKFPDEDAKNDFLIGLAEDNMAFVAYDDNTGEAIAVSKGDGEILFKGEAGFDEALPKQEDSSVQLQDYGDAVDRAHQDSAGDRGPTQEDEQEDTHRPS